MGQSPPTEARFLTIPIPPEPMLRPRGSRISRGSGCGLDGSNFFLRGNWTEERDVPPGIVGLAAYPASFAPIAADPRAFVYRRINRLPSEKTNGMLPINML